MTFVKISKKGMISLPAELRKKFNLKAGDTLEIVEGPDGLLIVPVVPLESLIDETQSDTTIKLIQELENERRKEATED